MNSKKRPVAAARLQPRDPIAFHFDSQSCFNLKADLHINKIDRVGRKSSKSPPMAYVNSASFCSWFPAVLQVRAIQEPPVAQIINFISRIVEYLTFSVKFEFGVFEYHTDLAILKFYNALYFSIILDDI